MIGRGAAERIGTPHVFTFQTGAESQILTRLIAEIVPEGVRNIECNRNTVRRFLPDGGDFNWIELHYQGK